MKRFDQFDSWHKVIRFWWTVGLGLIAWSFAVSEMHRAQDGYSPIALGLMIAGLMWFIFPPVALGTWFFIRNMFQGIDQAVKPIPEPVQLKPMLEQELGQEVSWQDTMAVHEYLRHQRNDGLMTVGISLGAAYLVVHGIDHL